MATKLARMVTFLDGLLPTKSNDPLMMWSYKITWQTKIIISSLPQSFCPPNLVWWLAYLDGLLPLKSHEPLVTWCCEITWNTKLLYLHYHHGTIIQTRITCKKICYMHDSACRWFIVKKAKMFWSYVKHFWILAGVKNVESWLVYANKLIWIAQPHFSTDIIKQS